MTGSIVEEEKLGDDTRQEADESESIRRLSSEDSVQEAVVEEKKSIKAAPEPTSPVLEDEDEDGVKARALCGADDEQAASAVTSRVDKARGVLVRVSANGRRVCLGLVCK